MLDYSKYEHTEACRQLSRPEVGEVEQTEYTLSEYEDYDVIEEMIGVPRLHLAFRMLLSAMSVWGEGRLHNATVRSSSTIY